MGKIFTKCLFLMFSFLLITRAANAQTITIGAVDAGPYGQGSTIAVPIKVDNTSGCITSTTNNYRLYLSDASGSFASQVQIGTYTGFYATFVNGIIPAGTLAGSGYRVKVISTTPAVTSSTSTPFTINNSGGVVAATSSQTIGSNAEVFGSCVGNGNSTPFSFLDISTTGSTTTATFINELDQSVEANNQPLPHTFNAKLSNYTVVIKAVKAGTTGTKAYTLINNVVFRNLGGSGDNTYCLGASSTATFTITIDNGALNGIKYNYPGLTYRVNWGDGTSNVYTYCQLAAANGALTHAYTRSSCGNQVDNQNNVFKVDVTPINQYCSSNVSPSSAYAKILTPPTNRFIFPAAACTNNAVRFDNTSDPGQDPNNNGTLCQNQNALYTWLVDGVPVSLNRTLSQSFIHTFATHGTHTVTLRLQNNTGLCTAVDVSHEVCVQDAPIVAFNMPNQPCLSTGTVTPVNTSVVDETCNTGTTYNWVRVAGPATGVSFNASLKTPVFTFNQIGVYQFRLDISTLSCGTVQGPTKTIVVNSTPVADLSPNTTICTVNAPVSFDPNAAETRTILDGTAQAEATTYTWTLSNGATFAAGSNSHSQYPQIIFPATGLYTVSVAHQNNCGSSTDTQQITVANGPTVTATAPSPVCEGNTINLTGSPGVGGIVTAVRWTSPTGTAANFGDANAPVTTYTPTAADIAAGQVILTYTVTTSLGGACSTVPKNVTVNIIKKASISSASTKTICSEQALGYTITSPTSTSFTWVASLVSGSATGFNSRPTATTSPAQNTINDNIVNTGTTDAVVTYKITPYVNNCAGNDFTLTVTVAPKPVGGIATPSESLVCSSANNVTITLAGYVGAIQWQQSTNNGNSWSNIPGATSAVYNPGLLTSTKQYRALLSSGACTQEVPSTVATVTVSKATPQADAGGGNGPIVTCNVDHTNLPGVAPEAPFIGEWTAAPSNPPSTIVDTNNPNTTVTGLVPGQSYIYRWTIHGISPCGDSAPSEVTIINKVDVVAAFQPSILESCGNTPIDLNNTTAVQTGVTFEWDFDDNSPKSNDVNPSHVFKANTDGTDAVYHVTLRVIDNCTVRLPVEKTIVIHPGGIPTPSITQLAGAGGCGVLTLTVRNTSSGAYKDFDYYLLDDTGAQLDHKHRDGTDFSDVVFDAHTIDRQGNWKVFIKATNNCGVEGSSTPQNVPVSPGIRSDLQAKDGLNMICAGGQVIFQNLSTYGQTFLYKISDASGAQAQPSISANNADDLPITFIKPGTFYVSVIASNTGCGAAPESVTKVRIDVFAKPQPKFTYTIDAENKVTFVNTSTSGDGTPATSFKYTWDFGDGSNKEQAFTPSVHQYDYTNSPYTVTLIAETPALCQEPYVEKITIKFPGELFLPNAFQPASSTSELRTFKAKGQKLKEWNLQIFNNWGQLIWQTTALDSNGSPSDGWDGTYKGQPVPQGTYVWQATARFINGAEWRGNSLNGSLPKRTGVIHLIR